MPSRQGVCLTDCRGQRGCSSQVAAGRGPTGTSPEAICLHFWLAYKQRKAKERCGGLLEGPAEEERGCTHTTTSSDPEGTADRRPPVLPGGGGQGARFFRLFKARKASMKNTARRTKQQQRQHGRDPSCACGASRRKDQTVRSASVQVPRFKSKGNRKAMFCKYVDASTVSRERIYTGRHHCKGTDQEGVPRVFLARLLLVKTCIDADGKASAVATERC